MDAGLARETRFKKCFVEQSAAGIDEANAARGKVRRKHGPPKNTRAARTIRSPAYGVAGSRALARVDGTRRIFSARTPVSREALARLVDSTCNLDDLIADIRSELRARPYELVFVAGGYQLRTKPRFAPAIRAAGGGDLRDAGAPELTPTEILAVTAI
ncbi:MAG: putative transcriptional, partial [Methylocystaceae bacterium]